MPKHKIVPKIWGNEEWVENNELYCLKRMWIAEGHFCSWHTHIDKDEVFYVLDGNLRVYTCFIDKSIDVKDFDKILLTNPEKLGLTKTTAYRNYLTFKQSKDISYHLDPSAGVNQHVLRNGDKIRIKPYTLHTFVADRDTTFFETSTHHEDSDSYRVLKGD